ncbi:asparagine synthase (glutamine-hydrolyzing) [Paracrocinitomix mangrovi]|uniref:asparagine synthase (glutamine-hydrolyzing) n=1 Tax=Paracrocinitomix mangrovi TaxID=2862509 RepID=UPI001C8F1A64|nr:asparagine synthase (glutamine-hydrolyzing) [Paracrocinitomix mangrovi]UKN02078.1 asparagine synthase (glutamine-hydrolyzing) [Paracrocinitomix mangrovi]
MCGINGIYKFGKAVNDEGLIQKMNQVIIHRGPDAEGIYTDEFIQLGHRRLSIIDVEERSNQPFENERYVLVFNGEIYNYKEIRSSIDNYNFVTDSDTEVILAAYAKWGKQCVSNFNGMFAFAIWDKLERTLFIARDRLGIKPLYYLLTSELMVFSSSLKAVLASDYLDRRINQDALVDYLRYQTVHAPYTLVEGVFMLMPGQQLFITEEEGAKFETYWSLTDKTVRQKEELSEVHANVKQKLTKSVADRLVSDVPFGAFLSGGIDSSIIVGLMSETHSQKVDTFSVVFKENEFSEREYAKTIADKFNTNHHEIELSVNTFKELIPDALSFMDHPSGDGPNTYVVSKYTREQGIKMALTGLGGDELFGGYSIFNQITKLQQKMWLKSFPVFARRPFATLYDKIKADVASSKVKAVMKQELFDMEYIYQFYRQTLMDEQIDKLLNVPKLPRNQVLNIAHELVGYGKPGWSLPSLSRTSVAEISTYMQNVLLRDADQMSMAHGLELRVPFLDHEFVEYVLAIPDKYKRPVSPKKLLVDSFEGMLPKEIYDRPKMGFVLPYEIWMKNELKSYCEERLNELKHLKVINAAELDKLWNKFLSGNKRVSWSRIWPLVVLGEWMKSNNVR